MPCSTRCLTLLAGVGLVAGGIDIYQVCRYGESAISLMKATPDDSSDESARMLTIMKEAIDEDMAHFRSVLDGIEGDWIDLRYTYTLMNSRRVWRKRRAKRMDPDYSINSSIRYCAHRALYNTVRFHSDLDVIIADAHRCANMLSYE